MECHNNLREEIFLIKTDINQIIGSKLPSIKQVLRLLFFNLRKVKLSLRESAQLVVDEVYIFWRKACIPTQDEQHCIAKLTSLYSKWRELQKSAKRQSEMQRKKEDAFVETFDDLFDIAHANALTTMPEDGQQFLLAQREKGRRGNIAGIDYAELRREEQISMQIERDTERKRRLQEEMEITEAVVEWQSTSEESSQSRRLQSQSSKSDSFGPSPPKRRATQDFVTPRLAATLDRCKISDRDAVHILYAAAQALGHNPEEFVINRSSIHRIREGFREESAAKIREKFQLEDLGAVTVHWDGKMLPGLSSNVLVDRLPVIVTSNGTERLLGAPALKTGTDEDQAAAVFELLEDWGLTSKVQAFCCDTTASNTGRLRGACILLEQRLDREILYLPCRHHIFEIVLKGVFDEKFGTTSGPSVPLFKRFQQTWGVINTRRFVPGTTEPSINSELQEVAVDILSFAMQRLQDYHSREDYRELLELVVIFLGGCPPRGVSFRVPGAMHHARWMAKAIYCLKIFIFRGEFLLTSRETDSLRSVCIFLVRVYIKAWFVASTAIEAPDHDLKLVQQLFAYEKIDPAISRVATKKLCGHLWYLTPEPVALGFFDANVPLPTKRRMVAALRHTDSSWDVSKRLIVRPSSINELESKDLGDFITAESIKLFERFGISSDFLEADPCTWGSNYRYSEALAFFKNLRVVNDVAERGVKLTADYNKLITKNESQKQCLLQVVQDHRSNFPDCKRSTLSKNL